MWVVQYFRDMKKRTFEETSETSGGATVLREILN